ncbi:MAG TPA: aldo/keto reductase [Acidimicrobiia bacterium]|nr:aldo/keto reductase [Acidimicrobiia bacterium]
MELRKVGSLEVTVAGLGCNNFGGRMDEARVKVVVDACLDAGINNFDTAESYGGGLSEQFLGRALGKRRGEAVITTKVSGFGAPEGVNGGSPEWIAQAVENSLARLGTDYIDLYLLHRPDPTPIGDTLEAFGQLIAEGKVREVGCSNFTAEMLEEASAAAKERGVPEFVNVQNHYSVLDRTAEESVIPACEKLGITLMPYFPLASGVLTGKYKRGEAAPEGTRLAAWGERASMMLSDDRMDAVDRLTAYAQDHGHTLPELALSYLAGSPTVASVIAGATSPEQVNANAAATTAWQLTDEERAEVRELARLGS